VSCPPLRLLMTSQAIDLDHPILAFSHSWAAELAGLVDKLYLVTLQLGRHSLPSNVEVFSLGKETGRGRLGRFLAFNQAVAPLALRGKIDGIFVQQTEINAILAAPYAKLCGIPLVIFKAHGRSLRPSLRIATRLVDAALTSEATAFPIDTPKKVVTGQGIDVDWFAPEATVPPTKEIRHVTSVGRYSPIKGYEVFIEAARILVHEKRRKDIRFSIYAAPDDPAYRTKLETLVQASDLADFFTLRPPLTYSAMRDLYLESDVLVHPSNTESLDKVVLEAMACGRPVITSTSPYRSVLGRYTDGLMFQKNRADELAGKIERLLALPAHEYRALGAALRQIVMQGHSLNRLADQIVGVFRRLKG
jgi:glycosyltransferase involved in cell wall biosynthesis